MSFIHILNIFSDPESVILYEISSNTSSVTAEWKTTEGAADYFEVYCSVVNPEYQQILFNDNYTVTCSGVQFGGTVNLSVTAVSETKKGETMRISMTTCK